MVKIDFVINKHFDKLVFIITIICFVLYLVLIDNNYVAQDEAYTFALVKHSYSEICRITANDVHPPLYYLILKFFIEPFEYNIYFAKIVSIVPYIFIIGFGGIQLSKLFNKRMALSFMVLFFLFPFSFKYSIEIRMYSLASAFVFGNAVFAYKCYFENKKSNWIFFICFGCGAAYTHYFALVSVGIIYLLLLAVILYNKKYLFKVWMISSIVTVFIYTPWLKSFIEQLAYKVNNEYWIGEITLGTVLGYGNTIFAVDGAKYLSIMVILTYVLCLIYIIFNRKKDNIFLSICMLFVPIGTICIGIVVSVLIRPIFIIRYIIPSIPLLIMFVSYTIGRMNNKFLIIFILIISSIAGIKNYVTRWEKEHISRENILNDVFVEKYSYVDSYIIISDVGNIPSILSYYEPEKPIYSEKNFRKEANPYENRYSIESFDINNNDKVIIIFDYGKGITDIPLNEYTYEDIGEYFLPQSDKKVNAYLMNRK